MNSLSGIVIEGKKLGRTIGFPTANIALPRNCSDLESGTYGLSGIIAGSLYYGIGVYLKDVELFEAHFFDFDADIYGELISVTPLFKIRENQKFFGLEELKIQIETDREVMKKYIREHEKKKVQYIAIAAMARNRIIGNDGKIPWHIPEDFRHFKETTLGHPIIMGRKTFESIGRILPDRENIILTRGSFTHVGATVIASIENLDIYFQSKNIEKAFVCGGGQIYEEFFRRGKIQEVILSVIDREPEGDAAFPYFEQEFTKMNEEKKDGFIIEHWLRGDFPHMHP